MGEDTESVFKEQNLMYQRARMECDERLGSAKEQLKSYKIICFIALLIAFVSVIGIAYIGSQSKIQPYAMVMSDSKVIALKKLERLPENEREALKRSLIGDFIKNFRTVYSDPFAQKEITLKAYSHLRANDQATQSITNYLSKIAPPIKRAETELVDVVIDSVLPLGEGNSYQVEWTENINSRKGKLIKSQKFRGVLTTEYQTPETPEEYQKNPTGLWIPTYQATEIK